jgi:hypothetical protein
MPRLARGDDRVDILIAGTPFRQEALRRARDGALTPDDVIVHKPIAWRPNDMDDVWEIPATGVALDGAYIERWAQAREVLDRRRDVRGGR